jgi:invasion protein IalB
MRFLSTAAGIAAVSTATAIAALLLVVGTGGEASAQQKQKQTPVAAQKQKQPAAPQPAQPAQPAQPVQPAPGDPNVQRATAIPTPWTKICSKDPQANKDVCLITQEIRAETGQFLASVAVREVQDDPKKQFIIAVPPGMLLQPGMRVIVDQGLPLGARYAICFPNACYGDMEMAADFVDSMKKGQQLTVQTINQVGRTVNFTLVLKDFAKAYDGPPIDPKVVEEQQKKLQEELQKRADEQRRRLEATPAPATPAPATPKQ